MSDRAAEIAHVLLREGAFNKTDAEHQELYAQLVSDQELYRDVERRLDAVGYLLVQRMGHAGVRLDAGIASELAGGNRMGMHAGHIRLLVYLWTHLIYRELNDLRRDLDSVLPGSEQGSFLTDAEDEPPHISYTTVETDFTEVLSKTKFKEYLNALRRWRFVRHDKKRDRIWADSMLYTLLDPHRMEHFVVDLARRMGMDQPSDAVAVVAKGTSIPAATEDEP